ncbi:isopeptide-forming domain-containing fimbrial protein [Streptomyces caniscabiei]|uniref:isopeptide-forming domain-containing fimbrial protein n=1 Tax=Streptomyces caniscabiei TaxID=2746961 RepID=UPI0029A0A12B|nr:isopeptide-forming domain-containing fimbrial protein [Streptomyces caniscabiei]MDX2776272.1 isopeptide-forming domain-containing fimbrial protein [Streptomyces caniscabiei]
MFRKIVSNLAFSPALVGQLGFYAKRLRKEETTRRMGLIFTALALVVQSFAVFTPPESANAANGNNVIYGGVKSKSELLSVYDRNKDSAGHTDIQQIYSQFGITRQDIVNAKEGEFNSRDFNLNIMSVGRSNYTWQRTPYAVAGTSTTVYAGNLYKFDTTEWSKKNGSPYKAVIGKRAVDGKWFAIMYACGNPTYTELPPPPPKPSAACSNLVITPINRTKFTLKATASVKNGATISSYTYSIKETGGKAITTQAINSSATSSSYTYDFSKDGSYVVSVTVATSEGNKTASACQKQLTVSPEPRCPLNPDLVESNPDCKPCEDNPDIWYKDKDCKSDFDLTKTVKNVTQNGSDANNTTVKPGDRLEYHLTAKNTGNTTGAYVIEDNLADVLEYADIVDLGGGTLLTEGPNVPVEKNNYVSWPSASLKPGESIEKIVNVQVKSTTPATPQGLGNQSSYDCQMVNDFAGNGTTVKVECPTPKVVEQVVQELPRTGVTENLIFAGVVLAIVVYFYTRSRQLKKEVRLIRRDLNAGTI